MYVMVKNRIDLTAEQISFVKANYHTISNTVMAKMFNINYTTFCSKLHALGLFRMHLEYWTNEQVYFLRKNYKTIGDKELAILFNMIWEKQKGWTLKHIEKKRLYLKLNRTPDQLKKIRARNIERGCWRDMTSWDTRGAAIIGDVRIWKSNNGKYAFKVIKTDIGFLTYSRYLYEQNFGPVPEGHIVTFRDNDNMNVVPENLYTMPLAANARRNRWKYPEEIRALENILKQLNKTIKNIQNERQ